MVNNVQTLIKYVVESFAEKKNEIEYLVEEKENVIEVTVLLNASDMGKVIGKQGKIAKALRTLVSASTPATASATLWKLRKKLSFFVIQRAERKPLGLFCILK